MEAKLKTAHPNASSGIVADRYGIVWRGTGADGIHGVSVATAAGLNGEAIKGFEEPFSLLTVALADTRKNSEAVYPENCRDLHHM